MSRESGVHFLVHVHEPVLLLAACVFALLHLLSVPAIFVQPWARLNGDRGNSSETNFSTIFVIPNSSGGHVEGAVVTVAGISRVTDSSGVAVIGGGNFTDFTAGYSHAALRMSLSGFQTLLMCVGNSYYCAVWSTLTGGAQLSPMQEDP